MFLSDFVVRNPKFKKPSGVQHEMADTLVLFKTSLICFQVKSKREIKAWSEKTDTDIKRINKRIEQGVDQLGAINSALRANEYIKVENSIGIEIQLQSKNVDKLKYCKSTTNQVEIRPDLMLNFLCIRVFRYKYLMTWGVKLKTSDFTQDVVNFVGLLNTEIERPNLIRSIKTLIQEKLNN